MTGYIWLAEGGFYFSLPELQPTAFGPFVSLVAVTEAANQTFDEQTAGLETYGGEALQLVAIDTPVCPS